MPFRHKRLLQVPRNASRNPYIDNAKAVLITVAINTAAVFIFNWRSNGVNFQDVLWDSLICAVITTLINMQIVLSSLKKLRAAGQMPLQVPVSSFMQRLPQHPFAFGVVCATIFAALTVGINALILHFFDLHDMTFAPWMVNKLIYATVLSIKIVEFCIFRYVQPDRANSEDVEPHSRGALQRQHVITNCGERIARSPRADGEAASGTAPAVQAIMHLFGKSFLNFFQFSIFITVFASLICKPLSYVLMKRCMQPDYIRKELKMNNVETQCIETQCIASLPARGV